MPIYGIVAYGVLLVGMALFVSYWWKRGNVHREDFGNWRKQSLSVRYLRGQRLSLAAGFLMFLDGFLLVVVGDLAANTVGVLSDILRVIFVVILVVFFACFGLLLTVMLFKWPLFLVPPWARGGKKRKRR